MQARLLIRQKREFTFDTSAVIFVVFHCLLLLCVDHKTISFRITHFLLLICFPHSNKFLEKYIDINYIRKRVVNAQGPHTV